MTRRAVPADALALARMRYEFRADLNQASEPLDAFVERTGRWMADRLTEDSVWRCWIATDGDRITGHLWLQLIEKIPNPAPELELHGYITNVYVDPAARGSSLGKRLMEAALSYCSETGVDSVILWPTERSRTLYARHGFTVPADMMEAILDPGRDPH